ncbi:MAG: undecaprenyldiphospho-muramoylpentapeptide beta-N-acetylglucosaminyltransferase [Tannerella sp.]|jgi:UDP-N-acetylglucosamine--N-acetylmuramyl-(pentapeptide) pyrophosphoryl-undecaprenol N-acetylglucosamine transferase|nr:undecaprenyldiphospho-muramoylpentapeptide beta-N-acetylglucosaminyltransferase [Tannerella sp.]
MSSFKVIISGGGTGGHIFPAVSIADEIRRRFPDADILFVGAEDRMEVERIPAAGYKIIGLPVRGFDRAHKLKNIAVLVKLSKSLRMAGKIIRDFKPDVAIGVGGYASGPTLWMASLFHIPILIQEQNSHAGVTNRLLAKRASKVCVAYRGMHRFFPADRIVITGNPVRKDLETVKDKDSEAMDYFGLKPEKPVLLVIGGSLGARTVNRGVHKGLDFLINSGIQLIWQTGKHYYDAINEELKDKFYEGLWYSAFISRMDYAYAAADLVVSRAGAGTLSELCLLKKPAILVPSVNVAEDHQTKNAHVLSDNNAAVLLPDHIAEEQLVSTAMEWISNKERLHGLSENIALFAQHNSAERIVDEVVRIACPQSANH